MESWIRAVKKGFGIKDDAISNKTEKDLGFALLDSEEKGAKPLFIENDCAIYSWKAESGDYVLGIGRGVEASMDELQDRLEEVFDNLLGSEEDSILFAARYVVIDDMYGLEVCGETPVDDVETVFYGLYLSDGVEAFYFTGFGSSEAESVFDELTGAARHFYRLPFPATILKGKSGDPFFVSLRSIAAEILPDKQIDWNILNATFKVDNGVFDVLPSVIAVYNGKATVYNPQDIYDNKIFDEQVVNFIETLPSVYDISGFTVTNFKDCRYGVTYYPLDENDSEDGEEEDFAIHNKSVKDRSEYGDLDLMLEELTIHISSFFPKDWTCGMGLVFSYEDTLPFYSFHSGCGRYTKTEINVIDEETLEKLKKLDGILKNIYPDWSGFVFSFTKGEGDLPDLKSIKDEAFSFDFFADGNKPEDEDDIDRFMLQLPDFFEEEFYDENLCVSYVTFKVAIAEDGLFVIEPATAGTSEGVIKVESFNKYLPNIASIVEDIFAYCIDYNTISVTIFPEKKFGFYLESTEIPQVANRQNIMNLLKAEGLSKYEMKLSPLFKDELSAVIYEVEVESSLIPGSSKLGGAADLPKTFQYPMNLKDEPFRFIGQVNLEEIHPFDKSNFLPKEGMLSFFFDPHSRNGKVFYFNGEDLEMRNLSDDKGLEDFDEYLPARLRFIPSIGLPIYERDLDKDFFDNNKDKDNYVKLPQLSPKVQMFGYSVAPEVKAFADGKDKNLILLIQLPSVAECDMEWGKAEGILSYWINESDLKELKFEKSFCTIEKGK